MRVGVLAPGAVILFKARTTPESHCRFALQDKIINYINVTRDQILGELSSIDFQYH